MTLIIILILMLLMLAYLYNMLVRLQNAIDNAWANIDVLLKQRFDELPALVESVKGYMKHERNMMTKVALMRSKYLSVNKMEEKEDAANEASAAIKTLFALAESHPKLKSNENFLKLQERISGIEDMISDRREYYNETVRIYNTRIVQFPYIFISAPLNMQRREHFKLK
jgi:LemA protein